MFQTFGNTVALPKAGVLFVDFERGHTLQVMGRLSIDWVGQNESLDDTDRLAVLRSEWIGFLRTGSPANWF